MNGAKMRKTVSRRSEKKMATVFHAAMIGRAGRLLVFFYPVKGIWLIIKGSP